MVDFEIWYLWILEFKNKILWNSAIPLYCYVIATLRNIKTARSNMAELIRHFVEIIFYRNSLDDVTNYDVIRGNFLRDFGPRNDLASKIKTASNWTINAITYRWLITYDSSLKGMALGYTLYTRQNKTVRPQILLRHHFSGIT